MAVTAPGSSKRDAPAEASVVMGTRACICGDVTGQTREVWRAIKALAEAAGGTRDSVAKLNTYTADMRYWALNQHSCHQPPTHLLWL